MPTRRTRFPRPRARSAAEKTETMSIYTVYEPPLRAHESAPVPERFLFVRDGFSVWAFLLAPLWMLRHRLWLAFVGYLIVVVVLSLGLRAIVDYGSGNLHSAAKAFERAAREEGLAQSIMVTRDPEEVVRADRVVLPGVGAFADCRRGLDAVGGMVEALNESVRSRGRPFLGVCVGMQLMAERGREYEVTQGLGWIPGEVERIAPADPDLKIPHMGWNTLDTHRPHPLLDGIPVGPEGQHAYFVHSFHLKPAARG